MMRHQLLIEGRPAAPARATIVEAAVDAMNSGFARADDEGRIVLHDDADIVTVPERFH